jgi:hypothetical protein
VTCLFEIFVAFLYYFSPIFFLCGHILILVFSFVGAIMVSENIIPFFQNFLFTSKDENSHLKAIDFGLSDFVKPGMLLTGQLPFFLNLLVSNCLEQKEL